MGGVCSGKDCVLSESFPFDWRIVNTLTIDEKCSIHSLASAVSVVDVDGSESLSRAIVCCYVAGIRAAH